MLIFAEKKADVDAIHEYLLLKGVEAVAIHGGKGTKNSVLIIQTQQSGATNRSMHTVSLFNILVVAHHHHQMPLCLQMSPFLLHSLHNTSNALKKPHTHAVVYFPFVIVLQKKQFL